MRSGPTRARDAHEAVGTDHGRRHRADPARSQASQRTGSTGLSSYGSGSRPRRAARRRAALLDGERTEARLWSFRASPHHERIRRAAWNLGALGLSAQGRCDGSSLFVNEATSHPDTSVCEVTCAAHRRGGFDGGEDPLLPLHHHATWILGISRCSTRPRRQNCRRRARPGLGERPRGPGGSSE